MAGVTTGHFLLIPCFLGCFARLFGAVLVFCVISNGEAGEISTFSYYEISPYGRNDRYEGFLKSSRTDEREFVSIKPCHLEHPKEYSFQSPLKEINSVRYLRLELRSLILVICFQKIFVGFLDSFFELDGRLPAQFSDLAAVHNLSHSAVRFFCVPLN